MSIYWMRTKDVYPDGGYGDTWHRQVNELTWLCCMNRITDALNAPVTQVQVMRTDFGRPSSSMRLRA
jgi:hypothetical protein